MFALRTTTLILLESLKLRVTASLLVSLAATQRSNTPTATEDSGINTL